MSHLFYLGALLISLFGLGFLDAKFKLAFSKNWRAALLATVPVWLFFVIWDLFGIGLGIFFTGSKEFLLGIELLPNFPVEELFFLALLCYTPLIIQGLVSRRSK